MRQLTALTVNHLLQNHALSDRILTDRKTYSYFKSLIENDSPKSPSPTISAATTLSRPVKIKIAVSPLPPRPPETKKIAPPPPSFKRKPRRAETSFDDIRAILKNKFPTFAIIERIPERQKKRSVKAGIIFAEKDVTSRHFLQKLQTAIHENLAPVKIISPDEISEYDLIITTPQTQLPDNQAKILRLEAVTAYIDNPKLKIKLWKELKSHLI